ncbi:MAG: hypothetical protein ACP5LI_05940 [Hydrogenobaculum sp.]
MAYSNYSIQNASTIYSAASGVFYNGNKYAYTLYNTQQINVKQPPLTTPYIYYFLPAYSQGYTYTTNTITNPQLPKNVSSTGVFYEYAIPIKVNSWLNSTSFNVSSSQQCGYTPIENMIFQTHLVQITIPYYVQMNTESGNCTGLTLTANQTYMGQIPFAIVSCNPQTQTITLIASAKTTNGYTWNNGYVLFGTSSNTSIANSQNQNLLTNNYTTYSNPNLAPINISLPAQVYVKLLNPMNTKTYFWFLGGQGLNFSESSTNTYAKAQHTSVLESIPTLAKLFFVNYSSSYAMVATKHLEETTHSCSVYAYYSFTWYGGAQAWNNVSGSSQYGWGAPSSYYVNLNLSDNTAIVYTPMTINYTLGAPISNPFLNSSSSSSSSLPSVVIKPPQNYLNTSINVNNTTYNTTNIQKTISNLKLNNETLLFGVAIPNYLFVIIDVIMLAAIAFMSEKSEAPIILALIFLTLSGVFAFSMQILALAILLVYLAYDIEKWHI